MSKLSGQPGVMPLWDVDSGHQRSSQPPLWYVMPKATRLRDALGGSPTLRVVVRRIAEVATTLADLHRSGIAHRDIKPENLFLLDGRAVVGDFGIATYPEKESITKSGAWLGPLHFMAPEMVTKPTDTDGRSADTYSLAKVLWVLALGERWPPPGQLSLPRGPFDSPSILLSQRLRPSQVPWPKPSRPPMQFVPRSGYHWEDLVHGPSLDDLDLYLQEATRQSPHVRLSMNQFADVLWSWLAEWTSDLLKCGLLELAGLAREHGFEDVTIQPGMMPIGQELVPGRTVRLKPAADFISSYSVPLPSLRSSPRLESAVATDTHPGGKVRLAGMHAIVDGAPAIATDLRIEYLGTTVLEISAGDEWSEATKLAQGWAASLENAVGRFLHVAHAQSGRAVEAALYRIAAALKEEWIATLAPPDLDRRTEPTEGLWTRYDDR